MSANHNVNEITSEHGLTGKIEKSAFLLYKAAIKSAVGPCFPDKSFQ